MKRATTLLSMLVLLLSFSLVSCDQMFSNNLFAGLTQKKITAASVVAMTPAEIVALTASADAMAQLAADELAKQAALEKLAAAYGTAPTTAEGQAEAIAAADISIKTVPDASAFAASAISLVTDGALTSSTATASTVADALKSILPADISGQLDSPTPPADFLTMISAFTGAYGAYTALSAGVAGSGGAYADPNLGSNVKMEIAVDAVISGLLSSIVPASGESLAAALWSALRDPSGAGTYLTLGNMDAITGTGGTVGGLISAAGLTL